MLSNIKKLYKVQSRLVGKLYPAVLLIFFAFTFQSNPPGWYQQTLPVTNVIITDIFFIDSLKGWTTARKNTNDSAFIFYTTNSGDNWSIQYKNNNYLTSIQFVNPDTGYAIGSAPPGIIIKTTNGGINWLQVSTLSAYPLTNICFINSNTGWVCSSDLFDGGVFKTINGGINWTKQTNPDSEPLSIFMINQDTGWFGGDFNGNNSKLFRTTNGGLNWNLQFTSFGELTSIFFLNSQKGWIRGGTSLSNGVAYTTNGGFNWTDGQGGKPAAGYDVKFINDSIGYSGGEFGKIPKSTDGGKTWGHQTMPIFTSVQIAVLPGDTLRVWAGRTGIAHTTDGGGPITDVKQIGTEIPSNYMLSQNYPNPFNPTTKIPFSIKHKMGNVKLQVFDASGKLLTTLINKNFEAGKYEVDFYADNLSSGVYFYSLITENFKETKKLVLLK